jgi:hypothetical protein
LGTTTQPAPIGAAIDDVMERAGISPESLPRGTRFPDIFAALSEPFDQQEVKELALKGRKMHYITARTAMNRLDLVLGPENWWDRYTMISDSSFRCYLTIRLPDGQTLTKGDIGGMAGMADAGDDDKSGASDAFKRAAVKFGVARYLYKDGVTKYVRPNNKTGHGKDQYASPAQVEEYRKATMEFCAAKNSAWADEWADRRGQIPDGIKDILHPIQMTNHLLKWGLLTGRLAEVPMTFDRETGKPTEKVSTEQAKKYVAIIYARERQALAEEAEAYAHQEVSKARQKWREDNEEIYSTEGGREG